jgi:hypothetical protein
MPLHIQGGTRHALRTKKQQLRNRGVGSISHFKENHFGGSIFHVHFLAGTARVFKNTSHQISFWGTTLAGSNPHGFKNGEIGKMYSLLTFGFHNTTRRIFYFYIYSPFL